MLVLFSPQASPSISLKVVALVVVLVSVVTFSKKLQMVFIVNTIQSKCVKLERALMNASLAFFKCLFKNEWNGALFRRTTGAAPQGTKHAGMAGGKRDYYHLVARDQHQSTSNNIHKCVMSVCIPHPHQINQSINHVHAAQVLHFPVIE